MRKIIHFPSRKKLYFVTAMTLFFVIGLVGYPSITCAQSITGPIFDQVKRHFTAVNQNILIPVGASSLDPMSRLRFVSVTGLPGALLDVKSDIQNPGPNVAGEIYWITPPSAGKYACVVKVEDQTNGTYTTASFEVVVGDTIANQSADFGPTGVQAVSAGSELVLPISAQRMFGSGAKISIAVTGLVGGYVLENPVSTAKLASATLRWMAPTTPGIYSASLIAFDSKGAYSFLQVPVIVQDSMAPKVLTPVFDQIKRHFTAVNQNILIPVGA
ncbi:MAG: hypothetical protein AAB066_03315, partial [Candidatus Margulisiibacteriota bacterium]